MNKKTVDALFKGYQDAKAGPEEEGWYVSEATDLDYIFPCKNRKVAFAKAAYWNAMASWKHSSRKYVVQHKKGDEYYIVVLDGRETLIPDGK